MTTERLRSHRLDADRSPGIAPLPWLSALALAGLVAGCAADASDQTTIVGVTVVDVVSGGRRVDQTVVIAGDSIVAAGPATEVKAPQGSRRVDGAGKHLIPGLWDMHVHLSMTGPEALPVFLANGVTGVRDMGGDPVVLAWRDSVASGRLVGPRIKAAGIIVESARWLKAVIDLTKPLNRPDLVRELERRFGVETVEDADRAVDSLARLGADFVKIRNYPSAAAYFALVQAARRHRLPIAGHPPPISFIAVVSDSGMGSFEHAVLDFKDGTLVEGFGQMPELERRELFVRLARNQTAYDPTLVSGGARLVPDTALARMIADTAGLSDPTLRYVPRQMREEWRTQLAMRAVDPNTGTDWAAIQQASLRGVREMVDAGVAILAGTDIPVPSLVPGFSLVDELATLVKGAGLTPIEALRAATVNAAATLGLGGKAGTIESGRLADLVLLEADPLADIGALRRVVAVVANGRWYDRAALDRLIASAVR